MATWLNPQDQCWPLRQVRFQTSGPECASWWVFLVGSGPCVPCHWDTSFPITMSTKHSHQLAPCLKTLALSLVLSLALVNICVYVMTSFKCPWLCEVLPDSTWQSSATCLSQNPSLCCAVTPRLFVPCKGDGRIQKLMHKGTDSGSTIIYSTLTGPSARGTLTASS